MRDYYEQIYANKMDNLVEMIEFLEMYNLPKLNQEETENTIRPIVSMEKKSKFSNKQMPRARWIHRQILPKV